MTTLIKRERDERIRQVAIGEWLGGISHQARFSNGYDVLYMGATRNARMKGYYAHFEFFVPESHIK